MPLNRSDLVGLVKTGLGVRRQEARVIVDAVFNDIISAIARGETVELRGVGTFKKKSSHTRWGRDFSAQRALKLDAGARVSFKVSRKLRGSLSGGIRSEGRSRN